jgi:translation initiation factor IF-2
VESERAARRILEEELQGQAMEPAERKTTTLDEFFLRLQEGEAKTLNLIVKADVQGSLEPIVKSLEKLSGGEVSLEILRAATGNITESDVMLASASDAIILGFNVNIDPIARNAANSELVQVKTYTIIYHLIEDVQKAMKGMLDPTFEEVVIGRAEVRQVFKIRNTGNIAGSFMRTGEGRRNARARLIRNNRLLHSGGISSLKHLQENVREIKAGFEFGVRIEGWDDYRPGDIIEFFITQRVES